MDNVKNRFEDALKRDTGRTEAFEALHKAQLVLAKELAEKGIAGDTLTDAEHKFMGAVAIFSLKMLMSSKK